MDYAALKSELAKPAYAGLSDAEAASAVNAATVSVVKPVRSEDVRDYLMVIGKWPRIAAIARGLIAGSDAEKLASVALVEALALKESFNLSVPAYAAAVDAQLDACASAGLITGPDKAAIVGLKDNDVPLPDLLGEIVLPEHVTKARAA